MKVIEWLLDSDPSIRWQVMRDLTGEPAEAVAAERARVATDGWGARLLALQDEDGQWGKDVLPPSLETTGDGLPDVASRKLLRELHRVSMEDLSGFLGVDSAILTRWEDDLVVTFGTLSGRQTGEFVVWTPEGTVERAFVPTGTRVVAEIPLG